MGSIFPKTPNEDDVPKTFQELWNSLNRNKKKYEYPRGHQLKILEKLYEEMQNAKDKDFAISLPTGTGKTVVGLLLSYYIILKEKLKVLYLCPNIFLCAQVLKEAKELDIPAVPLHGKWVNIANSEKTKFLSGDAVGVATYSTLFNSNPQVGNLGLIIMDDIHAAGDTIISNWSIRIAREENKDLFDEIFGAMFPILNKPQRLALQTEPTKYEMYEMLYSKQWLSIIDDITPILETHSNDEKLKYKWPTARTKLESYFCILHYNSIEIRPLTPPSHTLSEFNDARYRVCMSATPDITGNLENNVGIEQLKWISLRDVDVPGNRLILNLDALLPKVSDENKVISIVQKVRKTVILTQSLVQQSILKNALESVSYNGTIFSPKSESISEGMEQFKKETKAVILLAGRYDGIDLGDGFADGIILYHLPEAINAFENFTTIKWETKDEAEARAIQRIHQGMGRCTRRDSDEVQIFLIGEDLVKLVLDPQTILSFPGKLRLELDMCKKMIDPNLLNSYLLEFREKTDDWKLQVANINKKAAKYTSAIEGLRNSETKFMFTKYSNNLWSGNYDAAYSLATGLMQKLANKSQEKESAIWAYLAGVASDVSAFLSGKNYYLEPGNELFATAVSRSERRDWFGNLSNFLGQERLQQLLEPKIEKIYSLLSKYSPQNNAFEEFLKDSIEKLKSGDDVKVKLFLRIFGESLGFDALVPSRQGSPDCIWSSKNLVDCIFEAKTKKSNDFLTIEEVRQIIALPDEVKNNEKLNVPSNLLPICVTEVNKIAEQEQHSAVKFHLLRVRDLEELAQNWFKRLLTIHRRAFKDNDLLRLQIQHALITQRMNENGLHDKLCKTLASEVLHAP